MKITDYLKNNILYLDGGMGTLLQSKGLSAGELPERWNLSHKEEIISVHRQYFDAGSNVVNTNTFGANCLKFSDDELESIIAAAIDNAKIAAEESSGTQEKWVALDIGPTGKMLKPFGDLSFEDAVEVFAKTVKSGAKHGADLVFIETMNDSYETKAALLAAKENCDLPVFVSNAYGEDGKLMTGADPAAMTAMLEGMGADAIGVNCSLGPKALSGVVKEYLKYSSVPVIFKPNAGLPHTENGKTVFDVGAEEFSREVAELSKSGVRIVGGCCGTTPEYIKAVVSGTAGITVPQETPKNITAVSSYSKAVIFGNDPVLIGERINPTGKKKLKEAIKSGDMEYILREGISQQEKGVRILDVNVGLPDIDEGEMLTAAVRELQTVTDLPLQIDTSDVSAMEKALRIYNGKAMINSVNGKEESMAAVFPLAKKYGGLVVALTLDESGIPATADERLKIAEKILKTAEKYGISKKDIIFDPLALTVSSDKNAAKETLGAVKLIKEKLGCHTTLGVSNVSFGLPERSRINGSFFALGLWQGLSAAIMNPYSDEMMSAYYSFRALGGVDENCSDYIAYAEKMKGNETSPAVHDNSVDSLKDAIIKGLKVDAARLTDILLESGAGLSVIQNDIIPALNTVGEGFEKNTVYLPQLLMSAEAAKSAFERIKSNCKTENAGNGCSFVIATVKGDIHDIGKNIVKLLLENYGFSVCDLGKDVPPEIIADKVEELHAPVAGLSALMTTTVPAMEETVKLLKERTPWCKTVVGGAVLTEEYAAMIGADKYAKDAMDTVRFAQEICEINK